MKQKIITFLVGFLAMGLFYGALLYFFAAESTVLEIIKGAVFFGTMWGLSEVYIFPWIRKKFKKQDK
jgi:hypothetical protein